MTGEVVVLTWPVDEVRRDELARRQVPRLLLIPSDVSPPSDPDPLEDWARPSADPIEIHSRMTVLNERARRSSSEPPMVDESGLLRWHGKWVALGPIEARLATRLALHFGDVVPRDELEAAGWERMSTHRVLDVQIVRLRRHLRTLELLIHNIRGQGYVLEAADRPGSHRAAAPNLNGRDD